ncbi:uncharacterized protein LOC131226997 [Magnolia sinica]|uniref:uncharacterized protein LOC131226997 n=1 Tax=Magnolia sinica TaxID=86752 RepID=UPI00265ADD58|nr:uncharacterized protein LOC131226997 [Magnolia sinica]
MANEGVNGDCHDLKSLLSAEDRDYLVRNNGDQVKIANLVGKTVGLYFSASWCGPCRRFTPTFAEVYGELAAKGDFEVIFVSGDEDEESFNEYFSKMPWLAIPFADSATRDQLNELFHVNGIPHLVILDGKGKVATENGVSVIREYGAGGYPFTEERIKDLKEEAEAEKRNQTLRSILVSHSRNYVISNDGKKVPVSDLEGKLVGLYFSLSSFKSCREFTPNLVEIYGKLKERGDNFEVVLISLDDEEQSFKEGFESMPWLALPFMDKTRDKLIRYFELQTLPTLVIIGKDGKTLNSNVAEIVEEHGIQAYPFTPERLAELAEMEKARLESQTLESLLVCGERDFVIGKGGVKFPVADLVGKNILLYFSAQWCPPCRAFLPKLIKAYHEIKARDSAFEVIFISSDSDQASFDDFFLEMPWLALPFGDERKKSLNRTFKIYGIPSLVAIGPTGKTITKEARDLISIHGPQAYPFTEEHLKAMEAQIEELAKGWPEKVSHPLHAEHELVLTRRNVYICDVCEEEGLKWSYYCEECDFDLHPKCTLEESKKEDDDVVDHGENGHDGDDGREEPSEDGWICDGEVCHKADEDEDELRLGYPSSDEDEDEDEDESRLEYPSSDEDEDEDEPRLGCTRPCKGQTSDLQPRVLAKSARDGSAATITPAINAEILLELYNPQRFQKHSLLQHFEFVFLEEAISSEGDSDRFKVFGEAIPTDQELLCLSEIFFILVDLPRGMPLLDSDQKNRIAKAKARLVELCSWSDLIIAANLHCRGIWFVKEESRWTAEEMLRAESRTKTTVRRRQAAPWGEGPSGSVSVTAAPPVAPIFTIAAPVVVPVKTRVSAIIVPTPAIITPYPTTITPSLPPTAAPPIVEAPPPAPEPCITIPSSSERDEAVRMVDDMLSPPDDRNDFRAETQGSAGSRTGAGEEVGSAQVGDERWESILKILLTRERLWELEKRDSEVDVLETEAGILQDEATFLRLEQEITRLGEVLDQTRTEVAEEWIRAVSQAMEAQRVEDEASLAGAVVAAVDVFKISKEMDAEATKFYNCGFDACIEAVQDLYPDFNLGPLLHKDTGEVPAEDVRPDQAPDSPSSSDNIKLYLTSIKGLLSPVALQTKARLSRERSREIERGMTDVITTVNGDCHDLKSLLSAEDRDFLVRNNGDQVKIANLDGKTVGLYFSASWCGPCRRFTPTFAEVYEELAAKGDFEAVFVSRDRDEESFNEYFSKMPWPAIPFSDSATRDQLKDLFKVNGIPHLAILDGKGKVLTKNGVSIIREYEADGYPFTEERIKELKEEEEAKKKNQTLRSILVSHSRDFLISNDGNKVPVSDLEGKLVGLYFSLNSHKSCREFTSNLVEIYGKLKERGENFEVVMISLDDEEQSFKEGFQSMPWLALPFKDKSCDKLIRYFELRKLPTLVIIGTDGKTLNPNVVEVVEEHGIQAFPFTAEKMAEFAEIEKARLELQTLESILVSGDRDFVIGKDDVKVPVADLVGKHILLYFSAQWCPPCRSFLPKLIKAYHEIKAKDDAFEVIFISSDKDQASFDRFFLEMPWLALSFGDERKKSLDRTFKIDGIPSLIAIGPTGKTITKEARDLITIHGPEAYPFTEEHLKAMEARIEEMAKGWPEKVSHPLHVEHELALTRRRGYMCDGCGEEGWKWSYYCKDCDFDLHPKCTLDENKKEDGDDGDEKPSKDGWACDGEVCKKA